MTGQWFSPDTPDTPDTPDSSSYETDITEILLQMALNIITSVDYGYHKTLSLGAKSK